MTHTENSTQPPVAKMTLFVYDEGMVAVDVASVMFSLTGLIFREIQSSRWRDWDGQETIWLSVFGI